MGLLIKGLFILGFLILGLFMRLHTKLATNLVWSLMKSPSMRNPTMKSPIMGSPNMKSPFMRTITNHNYAWPIFQKKMATILGNYKCCSVFQWWATGCWVVRWTVCYVCTVCNRGVRRLSCASRKSWSMFKFPPISNI